MGGLYADNPATFLIRTLFDLYILVVMLRFLLQLVRANFYNPLCQFVVKATQPVLAPMRRVIPGFGGVDVSALVLMVALKWLELWLLVLAGGGGSAPPVLLLVLTVAGLAHLVLYVYQFAILVQVVISWVNPGLYNDVTNLLGSLTEPLLGPARRLVPPFSGLDLSPIVVLIALQLGHYVIVYALGA